jgi:hypothetical protein
VKPANGTSCGECSLLFESVGATCGMFSGSFRREGHVLPYVEAIRLEPTNI